MPPVGRLWPSGLDDEDDGDDQSDGDGLGEEDDTDVDDIEQGNLVERGEWIWEMFIKKVYLDHSQPSIIGAQLKRWFHFNQRQSPEFIICRAL